MLKAAFRYTITSENSCGSYLVVDTAENAQVAVEMVVDHNITYDLIFMGIHMGEVSAAYRPFSSPQAKLSSSEVMMDWYEAITHIRSNRNSSKVPVVVLDCVSLLNRPVDFSMKYQKAGISDMFTKPFTIKKLRAVLKKYVRISGLEINESNTADESPSLDTSMLPEGGDPLIPTHLLLDQEILDTLQELDILSTTIADFDRHAQELIESASNTNPSDLEARPVISKIIHNLKGISLNSGAGLLGKMCGDLERMVLTCNAEVVTQKINIIAACFKLTMKKIEEIL